MVSTRQRDTKPEVELRSHLHRIGLRFRLHRAIVPGVSRRPDIVFGPSRVAVFVDGCFWHSCPRHGTKPKANAGFWERKLAANKSRDRDTEKRLTDAGWRVIRVWEHENPSRAAARIAKVVKGRGA